MMSRAAGVRIRGSASPFCTSAISTALRGSAIATRNHCGKSPRRPRTDAMAWPVCTINRRLAGMCAFWHRVRTVVRATPVSTGLRNRLAAADIADPEPRKIARAPELRVRTGVAPARSLAFADAQASGGNTVRTSAILVTPSATLSAAATRNGRKPCASAAVRNAMRSACGVMAARRPPSMASIS